VSGERDFRIARLPKRNWAVPDVDPTIEPTKRQPEYDVIRRPARPNRFSTGIAAAHDAKRLTMWSLRIDQTGPRPHFLSRITCPGPGDHNAEADTGVFPSDASASIGRAGSQPDKSLCAINTTTNSPHRGAF